jgi:hypothetical protein
MTASKVILFSYLGRNFQKNPRANLNLIEKEKTQ